MHAAWAFVAFAALPACGGVPWHADLPAARAAAAKSSKPILAVFTASWSERGVHVDQRALASDEAAAVVAACFEPVRLDVDAHADLTRRIGVVHVPTACVLTTDDAVIASFECPEEPAAFVAAAARAAQDAALASTGSTPAETPRSRKATDVDAAAFGLPTTTPPGTRDGEPHGLGRGAISLVTAKVRQLSEFASGEPSAAAPTPLPAAAAAAIADSPPPHLPTQPTGWPAETSAPTTAAFTNASQPPPVRQSIEPSGNSPSATSAAWLSAAPPTPAAPGPGAAATIAAVPPSAAPEAPRTVPEQSATPPKKPSAWDGFVAAVQKPFSVFTKSEPKPQLPSAAVPPPTMPPARPASPLGLASSAPPSAPAADPAAAAPDTFGSMPLGLEGYCPVTLTDRGVWTEGRAQWGVRHRGRTYLFAGPEQQQAFLANPDRYAPALSGDDPVLAFESGRTTPGRRAYGVTYQSRMYLFASPETRATFSANPDRYTARVMLAERPAPGAEATRRY
jgi:YHS domain-containing protein